MLRLGGKTVALSTDCSLDLALETFDARTKDDVGGVDEPGEITGTLGSESLLGMNPGKTQQTFDTLMELFLAKRLIDVEVMLAAGALRELGAEDWVPGPIREKGFVGRIGKALIKSLRLTGGVQGKAKMSIQMALQGGLRAVTPELVRPSVTGQKLVLNGAAEVIGNTLHVDSAAAVVEGNILIVNKPEEEPINL